MQAQRNRVYLVTVLPTPQVVLAAGADAGIKGPATQARRRRLPSAPRHRQGAGQVTEEKPKIRPRRFEHILAVKQPGDEHWLSAWPSVYPVRAGPPANGDASPDANRCFSLDDTATR